MYPIVKLGKVSKFNGTSGKIVTAEEEFLFLDSDIGKDENIRVGSYVLFNSEEISDGVKRAFFVKKYDNNNTKDKNLIK